ncbi:MAG: hypothetical protein AVDCRST_MAG89-1046 [uncultured Gemmatimonadetes bacterium]|uniref:Uncharacterized protein n=1 Tax=uncultured Gemmatimonadota bacterium TaxID=203437 RepID=A0A6J4KMB8_9BACT|nr:MAG: hypothetical protein AVDCRST_MAG89-1046 [uncultured Gemmatimonadota bacterium]
MVEARKRKKERIPSFCHSEGARAALRSALNFPATEESSRRWAGVRVRDRSLGTRSRSFTTRQRVEIGRVRSGAAFRMTKS